VTTREGIEVELDLSLSVEIQRGETWTSDGACYPFSAEAVRKAIYAERTHSVEPNMPASAPRSVTDWSETIAAVCEDILRQIIAGYTLDQLLAVDNPDINPRQEISRRLFATAREQVGRYGGTLRSASISHIRPPRAVLEQRIKNWLADWQRREKTLIALGEARKAQLKEAANALAQAEMLQSLSMALAGQPQSLSVDLLSLRLIEALERMAREPGTRAHLDTATLNVLRQLVEQLTPKSSEGKA
jgi:regulator of protease activity HflC (stomatin/prohibitin superfamily)